MKYQKKFLALQAEFEEELKACLLPADDNKADPDVDIVVEDNEEVAAPGSGTTTKTSSSKAEISKSTTSSTCGCAKSRAGTSKSGHEISQKDDNKVHPLPAPQQQESKVQNNHGHLADYQHDDDVYQQHGGSGSTTSRTTTHAPTEPPAKASSSPNSPLAAFASSSAGATGEEDWFSWVDYKGLKKCVSSGVTEDAFLAKWEKELVGVVRTISGHQLLQQAHAAAVQAVAVQQGSSLSPTRSPSEPVTGDKKPTSSIYPLVRTEDQEEPPVQEVAPAPGTAQENCVSSSSSPVPSHSESPPNSTRPPLVFGDGKNIITAGVPIVTAAHTARSESIKSGPHPNIVEESDELLLRERRLSLCAKYLEANREALRKAAKKFDKRRGRNYEDQLTDVCIRALAEAAKSQQRYFQAHGPQQDSRAEKRPNNHDKNLADIHDSRKRSRSMQHADRRKSFLFGSFSDEEEFAARLIAAQDAWSGFEDLRELEARKLLFSSTRGGPPGASNTTAENTNNAASDPDKEALTRSPANKNGSGSFQKLGFAALLLALASTHALVVESSKEGGSFPYHPFSIILIEAAVSVFLSSLLYCALAAPAPTNLQSRRRLSQHYFTTAPELEDEIRLKISSQEQAQHVDNNVMHNYNKDEDKTTSSSSKISSSSSTTFFDRVVSTVQKYREEHQRESFTACLRACFGPSNVLKFLPTGVLRAFDDGLTIYVLALVSPTSYMVLSQSRLLLTALAAIIVPGCKAPKRMQWHAIAFTTTGVVAFKSAMLLQMELKEAEENNAGSRLLMVSTTSSGGAETSRLLTSSSGSSTAPLAAVVTTNSTSSAPGVPSMISSGVVSTSPLASTIASGETEDERGKAMLGTFLLAAAVLCKVASSIWAERMLKKEAEECVLVQVCNISFGTFVAALVLYSVLSVPGSPITEAITYNLRSRRQLSSAGTVATSSTADDGSGGATGSRTSTSTSSTSTSSSSSSWDPFFGWSTITVCVVLHMLAKNWASNLVVKHLSATTKYVIYAVAIACTYALEVLLVEGAVFTVISAVCSLAVVQGGVLFGNAK
ncbi:unnamed protein product [Amoebophrya sp. A25]|nr:unnamed protein product [Amoebophrya sp. A25]|eukprot:GSA25T00012691001.1